VNKSNGNLSLLYFDRYSFNLSTIGKAVQDRWREPRERYMDELFFSEDRKDQIFNFHKLRMEGHHRLSMPLLPLSLTLVGLAFMLGGDFNRRGQFFRILGAVSAVIVIEIAQLGSKNLGEKYESIYVLMYFSPLAPALVAAWLLGKNTGFKKLEHVPT
jgi:lipopolysaccharide export system permease protein